jgi:hypothetical protein
MTTNTRARIPSLRERETCVRTDFDLIIEHKKEV